MTPFDKLHPDTWIDRLWQEYINLRRMDFNTRDKVPTATNPAQDSISYYRTGHSR